MTTPISTSVYLINKTPTSLVVNGGALDIPPFKFGLISAEYASSVSVTYLINEGMAEISTGIPEYKGTVADVEIIPHQPYQGMSLEELQAEQAKEAEDKSKQFTTTPIGKAEEPEAVPVVEAKPVAETKPVKKAAKA